MVRCECIQVCSSIRCKSDRIYSPVILWPVYVEYCGNPLLNHTCVWGLRSNFSRIKLSSLDERLRVTKHGNDTVSVLNDCPLNGTPVETRWENAVQPNQMGAKSRDWITKWVTRGTLFTRKAPHSAAEVDRIKKTWEFPVYHTIVVCGNEEEAEWCIKQKGH